MKRWQYRLTSLERATALLTRALAIPQPDETQEAGIVQFFEVAFELGWKVCKDYVESEEGLSPTSPRHTLQLAYSTGLIADAHTWIDALEKRNLLAHTYDETRMREALIRIRTHYAPVISALIANLRARG